MRTWGPLSVVGLAAAPGEGPADGDCAAFGGGPGGVGVPGGTGAPGGAAGAAGAGVADPGGAACAEGVPGSGVAGLGPTERVPTGFPCAGLGGGVPSSTADAVTLKSGGLEVFLGAIVLQAAVVSTSSA